MIKLFFYSLLVVFSTQVFAQTDDEIAVIQKLADAEKYDKAIDETKKLLQKYPLNHELYYIIFELHMAKKDVRSAMASLNEGVERYQNFAMYDYRGGFLNTALRFEDAIRDFETAYTLAETDEQRLHVLVNLGGAKSNIRDFQGAFDDLMLAYGLDSLNVGVLNNLAMACDELGKDADTYRYLEKIIALDSINVAGYINLGFKYQQDGAYEKSLTYFDKAVQLAPEEGLARSNRSFSRLKTNNLKGAVEDINLAIQYNPINAWAYKVRALIYIQQGKTKKACTDLEEAIQLRYTDQYGSEVEDLQRKYCK